MKLSQTEQAFLQVEAARAGALYAEAKRIMQEAVATVMSDHPEVKRPVKVVWDDRGSPVAVEEIEEIKEPTTA